MYTEESCYLESSYFNFPVISNNVFWSPLSLTKKSCSVYLELLLFKTKLPGLVAVLNKQSVLYTVCICLWCVQNKETHTFTQEENKKCQIRSHLSDYWFKYDTVERRALVFPTEIRGTCGHLLFGKVFVHFYYQRNFCFDWHMVIGQIDTAKLIHANHYRLINQYIRKLFWLFCLS